MVFVENFIVIYQRKIIHIFNLLFCIFVILLYTTDMSKDNKRKEQKLVGMNCLGVTIIKTDVIKEV